MQLIAIAIIALCLFSQISFGDEGICLYSKGKVWHKINELNVALIKNSSISSDEIITVDKDSLAVFKFKNQTIKINENTKVRLIDLDSSHAEVRLGYGGVIIHQLKSKFNEINKSNYPALIVSTKTASMGIRGTTFFVYNGEHEQTALNVLEGTVGFKSLASNDELNVTNQQSSMSNSTNKNLKPRKFGFEDKINYNLDPDKNLESDKVLVSMIEEEWKNYKDEQEFLWKAKKSEENDQWENWKKLNSSSN